MIPVKAFFYVETEKRRATSKKINKGDRFVGIAEQFDDLTMLGLEYRGADNNATAG